MRETSGKRKPAHLAVAGLWLEAHQDNEHKVKEWCNDDCTKDDLGVFTHSGISHSTPVVAFLMKYK
jgi:hypothetical protein